MTDEKAGRQIIGGPPQLGTRAGAVKNAREAARRTKEAIAKIRKNQPKRIRRRI